MRKLEHELDEAMVQYSECEKQFERIGYDRQISPAKASVLLKDTSDRVSLLEADLMCRLNKVCTGDHSQVHHHCKHSNGRVELQETMSFLGREISSPNSLLCAPR